MRPAGVDMPMDGGNGGVLGGASSSMLPAYGRIQPPPFWSTPTPYLLMGFAVVMGLIAVALVVLLCSRRKEARNEEDVAGLMSVRVLAPLDKEAPKVVVVMAGDDAPSFLASATPLAFAEVAKVAQTYPYAGGKDADGV